MSGSTVHAEVKKNQHHSNIPSLLSTNFETLLRFSRSSHIADHMRAMHGEEVKQEQECQSGD